MAEHPSDLHLARRLLAGDERVMRSFFEDYYPRLFRFASIRLGGDADAADEVAQRTLCRALRKLNQYRAEASLFTWLCQLCRHEIHDDVERSQRDARRLVSIDDDSQIRAALESLPADAQNEPADLVRRSELQQRIAVVLDYLPVRYADVLEWKYVEELGVNEIAERLDVSQHAAESLLARARRAFKEAWADIAGESLPDAPSWEPTR
jgi:RNA polymerase sigma-70 factor (ECF subfamily)